MYKAKIFVNLKKSVFDPQGQTVLAALHSMDFNKAKSLRVGKYFEMQVEATTEQEARQVVTEMCNRLLVNPVIEDYRIEFEK